MTILAIAAEAMEFDGLIRHGRGRYGLQWPLEFSSAFEVDGNRWLVAADGPGPRLAAHVAAVAAGRERVDVVVSAGFCGALDPVLRTGDVFVASRVEAVERGISYPAGTPVTGRPFAGGTLISLDRVVSSAAEKRRLRQSGAAAVEMESAAVADFAGRAGCPFYCIRSVSDAAGEDLLFDFNEMRDAAGRFDRIRIAAAAVRRPFKRVPALISLRRRCREAALALGDFLADCRF
jgi:adenosylhomocysteine nucleosidase